MSDAYHKISAPPAAQPSGCPIDATFTPFDADYLQNPYPQLDREKIIALAWEHRPRASEGP